MVLCLDMNERVFKGMFNPIHYECLMAVNVGLCFFLATSIGDGTFSKGSRRNAEC